MIKAIYKITNNINGKCYIGQSINPYHRFQAHYSRAINDCNNSPLHSAIKKYGKQNFSLDIIVWTEDYNNREKELIKKYNSLVPNGYNICGGGEEPPHKYGEEHHNSVITNEEVNMVICLLKYSDLTEPEIGRWFKKSFKQPLIHNINFGITHCKPNQKYPIREECPYNLKREEVEEIKWLLRNSLFPCSQIAKYYQVNTSTIKHINSRRTYYNQNEKYPLRKFKGRKQSQPVETILAKRSTNVIDTHSEMGVCT